MARNFTRLLCDRRAELDEAALVIPVLLLVTFGLVNLAMLGYAGMAANNAANYGARMAAVSQSNQVSQAYSAASSALQGITTGSYSVAVLGGGAPGSLVRVEVTYRVPNWFGPFAAVFGASTPAQFGGTARADFRQEGW